MHILVDLGQFKDETSLNSMQILKGAKVWKCQTKKLMRTLPMDTVESEMNI